MLRFVLTLWALTCGAGAGAQLLSGERADPLRHALILAADGTLLGTCDASSELGIATPGGAYQSDLGVNSMFNVVGPYGASTGMLSAHNPYSLTPPVLLAGTPQLLDYVTGPGYVPTAAWQGALRRSGATRVTINRAFVLRISPEDLQAHCAAAR